MIPLRDSFAFPTYSGLLTPEHQERIGAAVWEFLWCIDKTTSEYIDGSGEKRGKVLGGKPVSADEIAGDLGRHPDTALKNLKKLAKAGYLDLKRAPYGQIIEVRNSKKFRKRSDENADSGVGKNADSGVGKNVDSGAGENTDSPQRNDKNTDSRSGENDDSNKTLQLDNTENLKAAAFTPEILETHDQAGGVPTTEGKQPDRNTSKIVFSPQETAFAKVSRVAQSLLGRMVMYDKEVRMVKRMIDAGIPPEHIVKGIEAKFVEFQPKFEGDRIGSLTYCEGRIREVHKAICEMEVANAQPKAARKAEEIPEWEKELQRRLTGT